MKQTISILPVISIMILLLSFNNCTQQKNNGQNDSTVPQRIVSLDKSITETLLMLGLGDKIVGIGGYSQDIPEVRDRTVVGKGFGDINLETLISLNPDIIFCWRGHDERILSQRNYRLFVIYPYTLNQVIESVERIGKIMDCTEKANEIAKSMRSRRDRVLEKINKTQKRPLVFFEDRKPLTTRAKGSLADDLITLAGGTNIARNYAGSYPRVDNEFVIMSKPEVIILEDDGASEKHIEQRPGWDTIPAVKNKRVHVLKSWYTHYSPRCIDGLEAFAMWIHPERHSNGGDDNLN